MTEPKPVKLYLATPTAEGFAALFEKLTGKLCPRMDTGQRQG